MLCGLVLMMRFGVRLRSRLSFDGTMPAAARNDPETIKQHNNDVKGRFGLILVVVGLLPLAVGILGR